MREKRRVNPVFICPKCKGPKGKGAKVCRVCSGQAVGESRLRDLIVGLALGRTQKQIAAEWGRTHKATDYYWQMARVKFGFNCYQDVTRYAIKNGLITI